MGLRDWFRSDGTRQSWTLEQDGFRLPLPEHPLNPARLVLKQLQEEGFASEGEGEVLLPWSTIERLATDEDTADIAPILGLPPLADTRPVLSSTGTPSDAHFDIQITGWRLKDRRFSASQAKVFPRAILIEGEAYRLPPSVGGLVALLDRWKDKAGNREDRFYFAARAKALASESGAELDTYLHQTDFIPAEAPQIELRASAEDDPVIEIVPVVPGAPKEFLGQFDRYSHVRPRYDVPAPDGGLAHIALSEEAMEGYECVKRTPARRLKGEAAEALLRDPASVLGPAFGQLAGTPAWDELVRKSGALPLQLSVEKLAGDGAVVRLARLDGEGEDCFHHLATSDEAKSLVAAASRAKKESRSSFAWRSSTIQLDGRCEEALALLGEWVARSAVAHLGLLSSDVFDRDAYSERVAGFDGKPIHVPVLSRPGASNEWLPEGVPQGIVSVDPTSGNVKVLPVREEEKSTLRKAVDKAKAENRDHVEVAGLPEPVPRAVVEEWLEGWKSKPQEDGAALRGLEKPRPRKTPSLRIFDNVDVLEFGRDVIPPPPDEAEPTLPASLRQGVALKAHQVSGVSVLQHRFRQRELGVTGLLLADDMGLGKTLQCLAFLAWYFETQPSPKTCLVVAPVSLLDNWKNEVAKFLDWPRDAVFSLYGDALKAERLGPDAIDPDLAAVGLRKFLRPGFADGFRLVLTTYETLRDYEFSFGRVEWGILVCDEAQKIKTPSAQVTRSTKAMKADFKIACTGTPVENTLADYWCLFDFFQPGMLGSLSEFTKTFRKAIELREDGFEAQVETLRRATQPLVLRRMKSDVADLPPKIDHEHPEGEVVRAELPMSGLQTALYGEAVGRFRALMAEDAVNREKGAILGVLHRLRMICSNPLSAKDPALSGAAIGEHRKHNPKLEWTLSTLRKIKARDEKVIVFTEFHDLQRLIQRAVMEEFGIQVRIINGETKAVGADESRQSLIDEFQRRSGFGVIVLSTTAVGFGVNVQAANHVIHFTRPWNPAKEDQATDRAYRIGQTKPVYVYTPTIVGDGFESFEQRVAARLSGKRTLSREMLAPEQMLGLEDFGGL